MFFSDKYDVHHLDIWLRHRNHKHPGARVGQVRILFGCPKVGSKEARAGCFDSGSSKNSSVTGTKLQSTAVVNRKEKCWTRF